jgi:hypothetical protein
MFFVYGVNTARSAVRQHAQPTAARSDNGEFSFKMIFKKGKAVPFTDLEWPRGFQKVKVPRLHDNGTGWW